MSAPDSAFTFKTYARSEYNSYWERPRLGILSRSDEALITTDIEQYDIISFRTPVLSFYK